VLSGLARDIGKLTRAAEQLSADVAPAPLQIARRDELGRLAHAFNRMVLRLESSTDVVRKQNEALAAHVAELAGEIKARDLAEGRLLTVANSLSEAFVVVDRQWRVTFANGKTGPYSDVPADQALGQIVWDVFPTAAGSEMEQHLREAMFSGEARTVEVFRPHRDVWLELRIFPSELGLAVFISDVTRRHRTREAQAERQRQIHDLASELLTSQSDERRAIARELHDEFGQQLAAVRINLQVLLAGARDGDVEARLSESLSAVKQLIEQIRNRALDLHPAILDDLGLGPALQWLCERKAQRLGVRVEFQGDAGMRGLPANVELAAFRIAQEAILNAAKHSDTESIELKVVLECDHLHLEVRDHGQGFEAGARGAVQAGLSLGLVSMRERAEQLGGTLVIRSERHVGTTVAVDIPVRVHA
jgi:signal transduction histidine kinase